MVFFRSSCRRAAGFDGHVCSQDESTLGILIARPPTALAINSVSAHHSLSLSCVWVLWESLRWRTESEFHPLPESILMNINISNFRPAETCIKCKSLASRIPLVFLSKGSLWEVGIQCRHWSHSCHFCYRRFPWACPFVMSHAGLPCPHPRGKGVS